jgi:NitT/TauT family transport system ATP-binding protein
MPVKVASESLEVVSAASGPLSALEDVSFEIADGEFVSIVGPSGCGKSTLLHVLTGFEPPDRGEALVDGRADREADAARRADRAARIGLPVDDGAPQPAVRRGQRRPRETRGERPRYIDLVGLAGFEESFPAQLSGGMLAARGGGARADGAPRRAVHGRAIRRARRRSRGCACAPSCSASLARPPTCLLVTHDVDEALHLSDRVVVMSAAARADPVRGRGRRAATPRSLAESRARRARQRVLRELGPLARRGAGRHRFDRCVPRALRRVRERSRRRRRRAPTWS